MRTRKGAARTKAKRRLFKKTKGYVGGRGSLTRTAKETLVRAGVFAFRERSYRQLWITRINAACRMRDMSYSQFMHGVSKSGIELDRKSLSEIAICDPDGFDTIVAAAKEALAA
jgi:large subunit ribosomal protein L20